MSNGVWNWITNSSHSYPTNTIPGNLSSSSTWSVNASYSSSAWAPASRDLVVEGDLILKGRVIRERSDVEELAEVVMQAKIDQLEARLAELEKRLEDK